MDVLSLLRSKTRCLERFRNHSRECLDSLERGNFDVLLSASSQARRAKILRGIQLYDRKITEAIAVLPSSSKTCALKAEIRAWMERAEALIQEIFLIDTKTMARIEGEQARLSVEINSSQKQKDLLGRFKSAWVRKSGEELDGTL